MSVKTLVPKPPFLQAGYAVAMRIVGDLSLRTKRSKERRCPRTGGTHDCHDVLRRRPAQYVHVATVAPASWFLAGKGNESSSFLAD